MDKIKLVKNISKRIVPSIIIFLIFSLFNAKINFAQTSEQIDPFYQKLFEEGKYFYNNADYSMAIENFEIAFFGFLDNEPKLLECYIYLIVCHYQVKNSEKSRYFLNEIKKLNLQEYLKNIKPPKDLLDKYYEVASYFSRLEPKTVTPSPPTSKAKKSYPEIESLSSKEMLEAEIERLKETIKKDKKNSSAYFRLSAVYINLNKIKEGKSVLEDLIKVDPKNGNAYFQLGKILTFEGKTHEAITRFQKAASFLQNDIELYYELGKVYYRLKNYQKAKQEFLKVQEINKTYKNIEKYLALIEEKEKKRGLSPNGDCPLFLVYCL